MAYDTTAVLLDPDIEVFYLKHDNSTLATYGDVAYDKYLIKRVHHYGKAVGYNVFNGYVADAVYEPTPAMRYAGLYPDYHTLDLNLRPGESRSEEHTSELQSRENLVCRLLLEETHD